VVDAKELIFFLPMEVLVVSIKVLIVWVLVRGNKHLVMGPTIAKLPRKLIRESRA
tara:strand:+ start:297 stop:461 length:165 start_codon:yes stop_codon:yes gene_type:complete